MHSALEGKSDNGKSGVDCVCASAPGVRVCCVTAPESASASESKFGVDVKPSSQNVRRVRVIWKEIPGYRHYEVSEYGQVRKGDVTLTPIVEPMTGRRSYKLSGHTGIIKTYRAAQLVARAFIGHPPFKGASVCHNDGVEVNDHYTNLRFDTNYSNQLDKKRHYLKHRSLGKPSEALELAANELLAKDSLNRSTTKRRRILNARFEGRSNFPVSRKSARG